MAVHGLVRAALCGDHQSPDQSPALFPQDHTDHYTVMWPLGRPTCAPFQQYSPPGQEHQMSWAGVRTDFCPGLCEL